MIAEGRPDSQTTSPTRSHPSRGRATERQDLPTSLLKSIPVNIDRWSDILPAMELALRWAERFDAAPLGVGFIDERGERARSADEGAVPSRTDALAA
jgi:hypothetical protein